VRWRPRRSAAPGLLDRDRYPGLVAPRLYTIGHSTRALEELLGLLAEHGVEVLVDVRRYPGSRRNPHFGQAALAPALERAGVRYLHEPDLGGRRSAQPGSPNDAWTNAAFRGYADHARTPAFRVALERVLALAAERPTAVMCAEAHPSRCHRRLIADNAHARGLEVVHVLAPGRSEVHALHPSARIERDGRLAYPASGGMFAEG
jgi:uncharacterized protein (DUF488 family)